MTEPLYDGKALVDMLREAVGALKDDPPDLHGAAVRYAKTRQTFEERVEQLKAQRQGAVSAGGGTGTWVYAATGKVVGGDGQVVTRAYVGAGGGGGGNAPPNQATGGSGSNGQGGCGRAWTYSYDRSVAPASLSGCRLQGQPYGQALADFAAKPWICEPYVAPAPQHDAHVRARAAQPAPAQSHCECGASFATVKRFECEDGGTENYCGDCWSAKPGGALPDRIAAAQKSDADPTQAWGAGATPSYDWEGR